jgi:hypothetical protein
VRRAAALVVVASLAVPTAAEVTVRVQPGPPGSSATVELLARSAPLAEVLDRLGRQIGMKVVYEGAQPRQLVTLSLQGRSAVETVLGLLEGQGLNFALATDTTGTRVETLLVAGSAPASAPGASSTAAASAPTSGRGAAPAFRRPAGPPPGAGPDMIDADPEELEDEVFDEPAADPSEGAPAPGDPAAGSPPPSSRSRCRRSRRRRRPTLRSPSRRCRPAPRAGRRRRLRPGHSPRRRPGSRRPTDA